MHQIYALPAPIRTFPLPTFYPNNPISLFHVAYAWLGQLWSPPPAEPAFIHESIWSPSTSSVHVVDEKAVRALWEQGFYGKGSLSRSEPNWLKREQVRRGLEETHVSEILTVQRREERIRAKWERARVEQEAIRLTRLEEAKELEAHKAEAKLAEARAAEALQVEARKAQALELEALKRKEAAAVERALPIRKSISHAAPVTPGSLLSLPNSLNDLTALSLDESPACDESVSTAELSISDVLDGSVSVTEDSDSSSEIHGVPVNGFALNGDLTNGEPKATSSPSSTGTDSDDIKPLKRQKSVRFSPNVESTTFKLGDPPSPNHSPVLAKEAVLPEATTETANILAEPLSKAVKALPAAAGSTEIVNQEHLQLMPEEAFFLSFALGVLKVRDPSSGQVLTNLELLNLFRRYSHFPPRLEADEPALRPDDSFLIHYAAYHHFRSLGWVPRGGIKFGVDWLLYTRGPVFDHAEFGLMIIPSYSDALWDNVENKKPGKTWQWLHSTVRVLSHVTKSLVMVYVDIPPQAKFDEALERGITEALKLYKIREVMVKRWSSNRNR